MARIWAKLRPGAALAVVLAVVAACGGPKADSADGADTADPATPSVAVTTNVLADVTARIGGDYIDVVDVMPRGADPHSFGLSLRDAEAVAAADLIIANGLGLEGGLATTIDAASSGGVPLVEIAPQVDPLPVALDHADDGHHNDDGDHDDDHYDAADDGHADELNLDPHFWTDPARMIAATHIIETELVALVDPSIAAGIAANAEEYRAELTALDNSIADAIDEIPPEQRQIVSNHHVFGYFIERFDFTEVGAVIPSATTLASPSAADLAELADQIETAEVNTIFAETSNSTQLADALADTVGIEVEVIPLYTESLGESGGDAGTYLDMIDYNTSKIIDSISR